VNGDLGRRRTPFPISLYHAVEVALELSAGMLLKRGSRKMRSRGERPPDYDCLGFPAWQPLYIVLSETRVLKLKRRTEWLHPLLQQCLRILVRAAKDKRPEVLVPITAGACVSPFNVDTFRFGVVAEYISTWKTLGVWARASPVVTTANRTSLLFCNIVCSIRWLEMGAMPRVSAQLARSHPRS
jgi:hypothetical protein